MRCITCDFWKDMSCKCFSCAHVHTCLSKRVCMDDYKNMSPEKMQECNDYCHNEEIEKYYKH